MARTWNRAVPTGEGTTRNAQQDPAKDLAAVSIISHTTDRLPRCTVISRCAGNRCSNPAADYSAETGQCAWHMLRATEQFLRMALESQAGPVRLRDALPPVIVELLLAQRGRR